MYTYFFSQTPTKTITVHKIADKKIVPTIATTKRTNHNNNLYALANHMRLLTLLKWVASEMAWNLYTNFYSPNNGKLIANNKKKG